MEVFINYFTNIFFADNLILITYGENYIESVEILKIHIWCLVFVAIGIVSSKWLISENLQKYSLYFTTSGAFTNIVLNSIFISKYGTIGAAFSTLISFSYLLT